MGLIKVTCKVEDALRPGWASMFLDSANEWLQPRGVMMEWISSNIVNPSPGFPRMAIDASYDGHLNCYFCEEDRDIAMLFKLTFV